MRRRGNSPRLTACVVTEKTPDMTAWDAMTVAAVASSTKGHNDHAGGDQQSLLPDGTGMVVVALGAARRRVLDQHRPLAEIIRDQRRHDDAYPAETYRRLAEMTHIGIQRLTARDAQENA